MGRAPPSQANDAQVCSQTPSPFRRFNSSPEVVRLVVMMSVKYPLCLRNVEDLLFERRIDRCHKTVRMLWNRVSLRSLRST